MPTKKMRIPMAHSQRFYADVEAYGKENYSWEAVRGRLNSMASCSIGVFQKP
ncbi:hypothetical protein ES288_A10G107300v1 [Gossypium darwinii]|uniref:Uncharacterized protein n=1 Tax=Gossypium darwinii TaxID=34276 RepID=A0A5D2EYU3_GOSDA|nr:hypothetical protein ES288_A10G107300v1 [Gossypium darwinii]